MKPIRISLQFLALVACFASPAVAAPAGSAFTYQGRLTDAQGASVTGLFDLQFTLFDAPTNGEPQGVILKDDLPVTNGLVTVALDFGANAFTGAARWLELGVRSGASTGSYSLLQPRQALTPAPYALHAIDAAGVPGAQVSGSHTNVVIFNNTSNTFVGNFSGDGSGLTNLNLTNISGLLTWQVVTGTTQQAVPNRGYIADNILPVTITLPVTPTIGDVVRVSGKGAGGWKIAQNAGQFIPAATLGRYGGTWVPRESNRSWNSVASSADGMKLAAVVSLGQIYTSVDSGLNWVPRESNRQWASVASSADGTKLVALVRDGQIYTSPDSGVSWTPRESTRPWGYVASSADGNKLVATVVGGQIYTSADSGLSWTPREGNRGWGSVASSADGTKLVAVVPTGQIYTSIDSGLSWTPRENSREWSRVASSADGCRLVAVVYNHPVGGQIYTSTDSGVSWTPRETNRYWLSVASSADGSRLVAGVGGIPGQIYTSEDAGLSWTARESNRNWVSMASSADGSKLVGTVSSGQIYTSSTATTIGPAGSLIAAPDAAVELQFVGNGQFRILSHAGSILSE